MEEFVHQIPELRCLAEDRENASVLDVSGTEREMEGVKACGSLHIPQATMLRLRHGNTVDGVVRQYVVCAGFKMSNDYPNNIGFFQTGPAVDDVEIVYLEQFDRREPNNVVVPMGRRFRKALMNQFLFIFVMCVSFTSATHTYFNLFLIHR